MKSKRNKDKLEEEFVFRRKGKEMYANILLPFARNETGGVEYTPLRSPNIRTP